MSPPDRVYVVDDDPDLADSVARLFTEAGFESRAFHSGAALLAVVRDLQPGCLVIDMSMPNMNGFELQKQLLAVGCRWPIIMLTGQATRPNVKHAMEAGIVAFLEKPLREVELLAAVMRGHAHLNGKAEVIPDPDLVKKLARLTGREKQVLGYVLDKKLNKQIGAILGIGETTVKSYRRGLMKKLGVHTSMELVAVAIRAGLHIPPSR